MINLLFIFCSIVVGLTLWRRRQQSEHAKVMITNHCFNLDLQLLSVARSNFNYQLGNHFLEASFVFEFSSDNDNTYQGKLFLKGLVSPRFELPVYRIFEDPNTLH